MDTITYASIKSKQIKCKLALFGVSNKLKIKKKWVLYKKKVSSGGILGYGIPTDWWTSGKQGHSAHNAALKKCEGLARV